MPMTPALADWLARYADARQDWDDQTASALMDLRNDRITPARPLAMCFTIHEDGALFDSTDTHLGNAADLSRTDRRLIGLNPDWNPVPRRNPQTAPSIIRQPEAPYFLTDGRAVFTGDELPDEARPGDLVYRDGHPVGMVGLDGGNRVVITTNSRTRALAGMVGRADRLTAAAAITEGDALQCVDLPGVPTVEPADHPDGPGIIAAMNRAISTTTPAEPGTTAHETLERMLQAPEGARITGINLPDLTGIGLAASAHYANIAANMDAAMQAATVSTREMGEALTHNLMRPSRAASMTDEEIRAAAIRRDPTAPTRAGSIATVEELQERLRDVRRTLREVRLERDRLRRDLTTATARADALQANVTALDREVQQIQANPPRVTSTVAGRTHAAVTAAKTWKDTPMTESVAKRDAFLALLATLEVLAD